MVISTVLPSAAFAIAPDTDAKGDRAGFPDPRLGRVVPRPAVELGIPTGDAAAGMGALDPSIAQRPELDAVRFPKAATAVPALWTEMSRTMLNPDGTYSLTTAEGRLNFQDDKGSWRPIDLSLVPDDSGVYGLRVKANDRDVRFGIIGSDVALAELTTGKGSIGIRTLAFGGVPVSATADGGDIPPTVAPATEGPKEAPSAQPDASAPTATQRAASPVGQPAVTASPSSVADASSSPSAPAGAIPAPDQTAPSTGPAADVSPVVAAPDDGVLRFSPDRSRSQVYARPTERGFEFGATLADAGAGPNYTFALDLRGLTATVADDGQTIILTAAIRGEGASDTQLVGVISAPVLLDADEVPAAPDTVKVKILDPVATSALDGVPADAIASMTSTETILRYEIDPSWLAESGRRFPVTLDPKACLGEGASGCDINGTGNNFDHFVMSGLPTQVPVGWTVVRVGYDTGSMNTVRGLFYFEDVTLPDGAVIYDSSLLLHVSSLVGGASGKSVTAYRVKDGWGQSTTWNQWASGVGYSTTPAGASATVPAAGSTMNFDVDAIVSSWYTRRGTDWKGDVGFAVRMDTENSTNGIVQFDRYSDATAANRPRLEISYQIPQVGIDFAPELGASYSPSTMIAGQATTLPITITNHASGFDFDTTNWRVGYRWFDPKGAVVSSATQALPACVGTGTGCSSPSATFGLSVSPPTTVGQYTLRLDLVRVQSISNWASDFATPTKYYARNKKVLALDSTRWTGNSVIERDEFQIAVIAGGGDSGTTKSVDTGNGGSLGIDLWSKNLHYEGSGGVGFSDLLPIGLDYRYDSKQTADCAGVLDACGWSTTYDERFVEGAGTSLTYVDPAGTKHFSDSDSDGQLISDAPVLLQRPRTTLFDEEVPSVSTRVALIQPGFGAFSGQYAVQATAPTTTPGYTDLGYVPQTVINTYRDIGFAMRTSSTTAGGIGFRVSNLTTGAAPKWFVYTIGPTTWSAGDASLWLGTGVSINSTSWTYVSRSLYHDIRNTTLAGTFDEIRLDGVRVYYKSGATGSTYVDGVRLSPGEGAIIEDVSPTWSTGSSTLITGGGPDGSTAIKVVSAPLATSPDCNESAPATPCWDPANGGLWSSAFVHWQWRKVGGSTAAVVFHLKDQRTGANNDLTYYAGPAAPAGALNPIQVSDSIPLTWSRVTRNLLEDARQLLGYYQDTPATSTPGAPPAQGPTPDDVKLRGFKVTGVDGSFLLIDDFDYGSLPEVASSQIAIPSPGNTSGFTYDFSATSADGSIHYFNSRGLLTRIADRDGHTMSIEWSLPSLATFGQPGYRLEAVHAATDATSAPSGQYERELRFTYSGTGTPQPVITVTEKLGTTATAVPGRSTVFEVDRATNDLVRIKPARNDAGCVAGPNAVSGCDGFTYQTGHLLTTVTDPRWDQPSAGSGNGNRFVVAWDPALAS
ncbi:MAG: DNRLRE domain-containing protein, partial [Aquihabitans sp.]